MTSRYRYPNQLSTRPIALVIAVLLALSFSSALRALQTCVEFLDNFASASYSNNNGSANFAGSWSEIGESSSSATAGDVIVDTSGTPQGLRIQGSSNGAQRTLNLSAYDTASLNFVYWRDGLDASTEYVQVLISNNGGTSFTEIGRLQGAATDSAYQVFSANITAYIASNTVIRFLSTGTMASDDDVYIDSLSIVGCDRQLTTCAASFPDGASSHSATGAVSFLSSAQILNSPDRILEAPSVTASANTSTCGSNIQCVAAGSAVATINPGSFETTTATRDQSVAFGATATLGPAFSDWDQVTLASSSTLTVDTSSSTEFHIDELVLNSSSTLNLPAGDYWIRNLQIQNGARINATSGTVRIYVNDAAFINSASFVNSPASNSSGTVNRLVWYSYGDLTLYNGSTMSGLIYSQGNITLGSASYIFGAATAANVSVQVSSVISYNTTAIDAADFGSLCSNQYTAVGWYAFDETSWSGAAGEVADGGSNNLDGRARTGASTVPATASSGAGCRYGVFDGPSSQQYVEVADNNLLDTTNELTVGVWVYARSLPASELMSIVSKDWNYEFHLNPSGTINWWWNDSSSNTRSFNSTTALIVDEWHHVAITYKSGTQTIYIDGVAAGSATYTGTLRASATPLQFGQDQGISNRYFDGYLDEVRIYNVALSQVQVQEMMGLNHSCSTAVTVDHFLVDADGSGITCEPETVTVEKHNASHADVTGYTGSITLSTSSGRGNWSLSSGSGTLANGTLDDGVATYTYVSADASVDFSLSHFATGTVDIHVTDGSVSEDTVGYSNHDDTIDFASAGLVILSRDLSTTAVSTTLPTQISGKTSASGWNASDIILRAVQTNQTTFECEAALPAGAHDVVLSYQCMTPNTCASNDALSVAGSSVADNPAAGVSATTTLSLTFDAQATAAIPLIFSDAGALQINAATDITDSAGSILTLTGNNTINVRPFAFGFTNIASGISNPGGTANSGAGFTVAGNTFSASVGAYRFAAGEDSNDDGVPNSGADVTNNGIAANFTVNGVVLDVDSYTPAAGVEGAFSVSSLNFSNGTAALSGATYSEVGSIVLLAQTTDYLGVTDADIQGISPTIGRFYPQQFALVSSTVTPACSTGTPFTYMDQPAIHVEYLLQAQNAGGVVTRNYDTTANYDTGDIIYAAENADNGADLGLRLVITDGRWDDGVYVVSDGDVSFLVDGATFTRAPADADSAPDPDGPFSSLQLGLEITNELDNRVIASPDMQEDLAGACAPGCTQKILGAVTDVRYGRLAMRDTTGSELAQAISIPAFAEYFAGTEFVRNYDDSCSVYGASVSNAVSFSGHSGDLTVTDLDADNWHLPTADTALLSGTLQNYPNGLHILPVGKTGSVVLTLANTPVWLRYDWFGSDADLTPVDPFATLTFGQYRGHDRIILWRELH